MIEPVIRAYGARVSRASCSTARHHRRAAGVARTAFGRRPGARRTIARRTARAIAGAGSRPSHRQSPPAERLLAARCPQGAYAPMARRIGGAGTAPMRAAAAGPAGEVVRVAWAPTKRAHSGEQGNLSARSSFGSRRNGKGDGKYAQCQ